MTSPPGELTVDVQSKPGSQVEIRVEAPASALETAIDAALQRIARASRIPGFRPGKAPASVVERAVGWPAVKREATEHLIPDLYAQALDQAGIEAVDEPHVDLDDIERGMPVAFTVTVTIRPEVDLGDLSTLRVDENTTEVTEDQVADTLEEVRRRNADMVAVDRPSQAGDVLGARLTMRAGDQVVGGSGEERDLEIDREKLLPGMADAVIGLTAGAQRSFQLTLPDDFEREDLRGRVVDVDVQVGTVRERRLPPLDDELAKLDGNATTVGELREYYRRRLIEAAAASDSERYEIEVLEALRDRVAADIPAPMVDREIDRQLGELELRVVKAGIPFERYLALMGSSIEQLRGETRETAVRRVKIDLALDRLADVEQVEVEESAVHREEERIRGGQKLTREQRQRLHAISRLNLRRQAAVDRALELARGE
jgi:trigger factor